MEVIALVIALVITNILWMIFYILTIPNSQQSKMTVKRIEPFVKRIKRANKAVDEIEEQLKNMQEVTEAPLEDVKKSAKLS